MSVNNMFHSYMAGSILPFIRYFLLQESTPKCEELKHDDPFSIFGQPIIKNQIPYTTKSNPKTISDKVTQPEKQVSFSRVQGACHIVQVHNIMKISF